MIDGDEGTPSEPFTLRADPGPVRYLSIPLQTPEGYTPNDASVGDLDGDGDYEIVLQAGDAGAGTTRRPASTGQPILEAYDLDGTLLWRIDLGRNIREGAHYTQFLVYDSRRRRPRRGRLQDGRRHRRWTRHRSSATPTPTTGTPAATSWTGRSS